MKPTAGTTSITTPAGPRGAGRPRSFDHDAVLDAAVEVFWGNGFRGTTTRDLEAALGLAPSSIYNAFGSKRDLLTAALDRYERQITDSLLGPLETSNEGLAALDAFFCSVGTWIAAHRRQGCLLINTMAEDGGTTDRITRRASQYRLRLRRAFHGALIRSAAAGETNDDHLEARADLLLSALLGLNIAARGGATPAELGRLTTGVRTQVEGWRVTET